MNPFLLRLEGPDARSIAARLMKASARSRLSARAWESEDGFVFSCGLGEGSDYVYRSKTGTLHQGDNSWDLPRDRFSDSNAAVTGALLRLAGHEPIGLGTDGDFEAGYEHARANWPTAGKPPQPSSDPLIAIDGEMAIATALLGAGCGVFSVSASAPVSAACSLLGSLPPKGRIRIIEAGDSVAAAFSAAGAGYGGIRAAADIPEERELLGAPGAAWAASAEVPFVLIVSEPGAPESFGGIVRAPASVREVYRHCVEAFDLAESYQTSVTVVIEPTLRSRWETISEPAASPELHRGRWVVPSNNAPFDRYAVTEDGVSPRSAPGMGGLEHSTLTLERESVSRRKDRIEKLSLKDASVLAAFGPGPVLGSGDGTVLVARGAIAAQLRATLEAGTVECGLLPIRTLRPFAADEIGRRLAGKRVLVAAERPDDTMLRLIRADAGVTAAEEWRVHDSSDLTAMIDSLKGVLIGG